MMNLSKQFPLRSLSLLLLMAFPLLLRAVDPVLVWSDEFEVDGLPDATKWLHDVGGDGWGNNEEQYYTNWESDNFVWHDDMALGECR